ITIDKFTGQFVYSQPEKDLDDAIGIGVAYKVAPKLTVGTKYFTGDELHKADDGIYDVYGIYNVGAWDIKFGASNARNPYGHCGDKNEGGNYSDKQAKYEDDPFFYAGVHFEF
ncbi:MAG TPA: hypothetical protein VEC37_05360, partial [Bacillota bacterium]|nr:hypothetical protein [Bacillota bacterium]